MKEARLNRAWHWSPPSIVSAEPKGEVREIPLLLTLKHQARAHQWSRTFYGQ